MFRSFTVLVLGGISVVVGVGAAIPVYLQHQTAPYVVDTVEEAPTSTVAIVLGASVVRGEPSPVLRERALGALALYNAGKVEKILVSGDDSVEGFDEVSPVRRLLQEGGVANEDIFLDHAGFDTYSTMYRARDIFGVHDVIIVTQAFHLPRAIFLAHRLGLEATGLAVATHGNPLENEVREWGASIKAIIDLATTRVPEYLGQKFPITGNGEETWEWELSP